MKENFLSVVIPTFNRPAKLGACLAALARANFKRSSFEVIVVDDGSEPPMKHDQLARGIDFTLVRQKNGGPAKARNAGAGRAQGSLLVFTDDDCLPDEEWLTRIAAAHQRAPEAALGGRCVNGLAGNPYSTASQMLVDYLYAYDDRQPSGPRFFTSNNFAVPAASFGSLGGFDTRFPDAAGEDRDFCERWRHAGKALLHVPDAVVSHSHELDLHRFWIQHLDYGRAAYLFHRSRAARLQEPLRVEPLGFYFGLVTYPRGRVPLPRALALSVLLFLSQFANACGFFLERRRGPARRKRGQKRYLG